MTAAPSYCYHVDGGPDLDIREALTIGHGRYTCSGLAHALRSLGREAAGMVSSIRGRTDRLTVRGVGGAEVTEPAVWGGNTREDIPAILAASAALGHPGKRLSTAIVKAIPARTGRTLEARTIAQACLPPPYMASAGLCAVVQADPRGPDRWRAGEAWASLAMRAGEGCALTSEAAAEWRKAVGPVDVRSAVAELRLGGERGQNGCRVVFAPWVGHIDIRTAYSAHLAQADLRRVQPIIRPADWHRGCGDVTGLLPGRLDLPEGMLRHRRWPDSIERVQVETAPDRALTDAVHRVLAVCAEAGGRAAYRAAGRVMYGLLHGSDTARQWVPLSDLPDGVWHHLAGRALVERPAALTPFCEPAAAYGVLDACRIELQRAADALAAAGYHIVQAHTDGLLVAGPRDPLLDIGTPAPWAEWRHKGRGSVAHVGPGRYLSASAGVVWAGESPASQRWRRLCAFLHDTIDFLSSPCAS